MKRFLFFWVIAITHLTITAQTVDKIHFTYDEFGNRIKREYITAQLLSQSTIKSYNISDDDESKNAIKAIGTSNIDSTNLHSTLINIYPIPVKSILTVSNASNSVGTITIYNEIGIKVLNMDIQEGQNTVNFGSIAAGTYILFVKTQTMNQQWKIVKE